MMIQFMMYNFPSFCLVNKMSKLFCYICREEDTEVELREGGCMHGAHAECRKRWEEEVMEKWEKKKAGEAIGEIWWCAVNGCLKGQEFLVDKIVGRLIDYPDVVDYKVQWLGWSSLWDEWIPREQLVREGAAQLVAEYERHNPLPEYALVSCPPLPAPPSPPPSPLPLDPEDECVTKEGIQNVQRQQCEADQDHECGGAGDEIQELRKQVPEPTSYLGQIKQKIKDTIGSIEGRAKETAEEAKERAEAPPVAAIPAGPSSSASVPPPPAMAKVHLFNRNWVEFGGKKYRFFRRKTPHPAITGGSDGDYFVCVANGCKNSCRAQIVCHLDSLIVKSVSAKHKT